MGIPFYFVSLIKQHRGIVSRVRVKLQPDVLAIDCNCLIHTYMDNSRPIESILEAIEKLKETCEPRKLLYIGMDGLVPYAKIVQQRYRRFRKPEEQEFDRLQISPGTPYMKDLATAIRNKFPYAILSDTSEPGEGEHKIFAWLKSTEAHNRRSICVYGLDADLILLSLSQTSLCMPRSFWLLRENPSFHDKAPGFSTLSISALKDIIGMPIEQYIMMSVMCFGNDFVPNLGMFSLRQGGYERALRLYGGEDLLTPEGRREFIEKCAKEEFSFYKETIPQRPQPAEKAIWGGDGVHFEIRYNLHIQDGSQPEDVCDSYWKIVQWTYHYFTQNECLDWNFYYEFPEAPLLCQLARHPEQVHKWNSKAPKFNITKQLQFILPQKSLHLAKKRALYPDEFYEEDHMRVPWMRKYAWECEPYISLPSEEIVVLKPFLI